MAASHNYHNNFSYFGAERMMNRPMFSPTLFQRQSTLQRPIRQRPQQQRLQQAWDSTTSWTPPPDASPPSRIRTPMSNRDSQHDCMCSNQYVSSHLDKTPPKSTLSLLKGIPKRFHPMEDRIKNPCKVFIGGIGQGTVEPTLRSHFSQYGEIADCVIVTHRKSGKNRVFGFVTFTRDTEAQAATQAKHKIDDVMVECRQALPRDEARVTVPSDSLYMPTKVFVGGLPDTVQEEELKSLFLKFGDIVDVSLAYDKSNHRPRGFGFIVFSTAEAAYNAVGRHIFYGRIIEAKHAVPRDIPKLPRMRSGRRRMSQLKRQTRNPTFTRTDLRAWHSLLHEFPNIPSNQTKLNTFPMGHVKQLGDTSPVAYPYPSHHESVLNSVDLIAWNLGGQNNAAHFQKQVQRLPQEVASPVCSPRPFHFSESYNPLGQEEQISQHHHMPVSALPINSFRTFLLNKTESCPSTTKFSPTGFQVKASQSMNTEQNDLLNGQSARLSPTSNCGLLTTNQNSSDWTPNFFFFNLSGNASPLQAMQPATFVPVTSPLNVPGQQPQRNGITSVESLCLSQTESSSQNIGGINTQLRPAEASPHLELDSANNQLSPLFTWVQMFPQAAQKIGSFEKQTDGAEQQKDTRSLFTFVNAKSGVDRKTQPFVLTSQTSLNSSSNIVLPASLAFPTSAFKGSSPNSLESFLASVDRVTDDTANNNVTLVQNEISIDQ